MSKNSQNEVLTLETALIECWKPINQAFLINTIKNNIIHTIYKDEIVNKVNEAINDGKYFTKSFLSSIKSFSTKFSDISVFNKSNTHYDLNFILIEISEAIKSWNEPGSLDYIRDVLSNNLLSPDDTSNIYKSLIMFSVPVKFVKDIIPYIHFNGSDYSPSSSTIFIPPSNKIAEVHKVTEISSPITHLNQSFTNIAISQSIPVKVNSASESDIKLVGILKTPIKELTMPECLDLVDSIKLANCEQQFQIIKDKIANYKIPKYLQQLIKPTLEVYKFSQAPIESTKYQIIEQLLKSFETNPKHMHFKEEISITHEYDIENLNEHSQDSSELNGEDFSSWTYIH